MPTWIALFRGINVSGKNLLPMAELKQDFDALKFKNVRTYIQSGNVIFESAHKSKAPLSKLISRAIFENHQLSPSLLLLEPEELATAIASNPFPKATQDPATLHFFFLAEAPSQSCTSKLKQIMTESEDFKLVDKVLYVHAPNGFAGSKLASNAERHLGVVATARNYKTVDRLRSMLQGS